ncbi:hypothetical protein DBV05_g6987 [Lasiodiplodia theobromae]|uniref:Uncharacterized protein n=1 Tax=Lasiodiplodia theobromae TaxID=45133 RepID=A0A5N5D9N5_9PEZI|nr:hypothetical protein DBV05_g6987 [Lasiodiplodia theobromae]
MIKKAPISTKMASGPYMCKTFLNPDAGSRIDLGTCNSKGWLEEEITNAAYDVLNGPKRTPLKRKPNPFKSAFVMSITRVSPKEEAVYTLGKICKKNIPSFMDPDASLSPREDILSLLEEKQSTDEKSRSLLGQIKKCAEYLVEKRQRRAQTANWERFALGTDYRCGYCAAKGREKTYDQYLLIEHLQKEHRAPPSDDDRFDTYREILRHFRTEAVA